MPSFQELSESKPNDIKYYRKNNLFYNRYQDGALNLSGLDLTDLEGLEKYLKDNNYDVYEIDTIDLSNTN